MADATKISTDWVVTKNGNVMPQRSLTQRLDALERANETRTKRANLKRDLKAGRVDYCAILQNPPDYIESMKLFDFMMSLPKHGRVKVNKRLVQCRISPSKTIGGLSDRQRDEIISLLTTGTIPRESQSIYPVFIA